MKFSISGIYEIRNKINGKRYIGSSVSIVDRWDVHKSTLKSKKHHCIHLQNAWHKYGEDAFIFNIIERCDKENLTKREQYFFELLKPEYNIYPIARSSLGHEFSLEARGNISKALMGRVVSEETRKKLSDALKGNKINLGRKATPETRAKISEANKRRSPEYRVKLSVAGKGRKCSEKTLEKLRANAKNMSAETREKLSRATKAWWDKKKLSNTK